MSNDTAVEIELKYRLAQAPPANRLGEGQEIDQVYLVVGDSELRMRKRNGICTMTAKSAGTMVRQEWEHEIPVWVFESLAPSAVGRLRKTRYVVQAAGNALEIDRYYDELDGLWTVECELASEAAAEAFALPEWLGTAEDITSDKRFKNKNLATTGLA